MENFLFGLGYFILFCIIYTCVMCCLSDGSPLRYSCYIARYEGFSKFFGALFWTLFLPNKYFCLSSITKSKYDIKHLSTLEMICRDYLNDKGSLRISEDSCDYSFSSETGSIRICCNTVSVSLGNISYAIVPPYHIRLVEQCIKMYKNNTMKSKNVFDK